MITYRVDPTWPSFPANGPAGEAVAASPGRSHFNSDIGDSTHSRSARYGAVPIFGGPT